jgi:Ca-activated chloride channel homolog
VSLLSPGWLLAGGLLGPLVLWYVLRSRRPPRVVPSTMLLADEEQTASAAVPWQPFRGDRTFWLVALATVLAAVGLARPAIAVPAEVGDHTIVVVDVSASMGAVTEAGGTRLEAARAVVGDLLDRAGDARVVSIV